MAHAVDWEGEQDVSIQTANGGRAIGTMRCGVEVLGCDNRLHVAAAVLPSTNRQQERCFRAEAISWESK